MKEGIATRATDDLQRCHFRCRYVRLTWRLILAFRKNRLNTKLFSSATWSADITMQIAKIEFKFADRTRSFGYQIPLAFDP